MEGKVIQTTYKGYRFRSRLEARWAVFFDRLEIEWEYEKEGYQFGKYSYYLPDFWLPHVYDRFGKEGVWVEIKGKSPTKKEDKSCFFLASLTKHSSYLFCGLPDHDSDCGYHFGSDGSWDNYMRFMRCLKCGSMSFEYSMESNYEKSPCHKKSCRGKSTFSHPLIFDAITTAKQARFEYGK